MLYPNKYKSEVDKKLGKFILLSRTSQGMSRDQLCKQIEVTHQQLQKYEMGKNRITVGRFVLIAQALGIKPETILKVITDKDWDDNEIIKQQTKCTKVARALLELKNEHQVVALHNLIKAISQTN